MTSPTPSNIHVASSGNSDFVQGQATMRQVDLEKGFQPTSTSQLGQQYSFENNFKPLSHAYGFGVNYQGEEKRY